MNVSFALRNHYQTLGVGFRATPSEVKSAFRALAKKYHPDQNQNNPNAERRFREVKEAYECLSNKLKRAEYDRDWVRTGRVHWERKTESSTSDSGSADENPSGELSRNQLLALYAAVIGLPFLASLIRTGSETSTAATNKLKESSWVAVPDLPQISPRDQVVRAFYNPLTKRWEKLEASADPPSPLELFKYVVKEHRGAYQRILQTDRLPMPSKDDVFAVHEVPARLTKEPLMTIDRASGMPMFSADSHNSI